MSNYLKQITSIQEELKVFSNIEFKESIHTYNIGDYTFPISATGWVKQFENKFDEDYWATFKANQRGVDKQVILDEWENKRKYATNILGTPTHYFMECYYTNKEFKTDIEDDTLNHCINLGKQFISNNKFLLPIMSEVIVGSKEIGVAGMLDQLFYNTLTDKIELWDWKTSAEIKKKAFRNKKMKFPFNDLPDANLYHYTIQLNFYKYMIERYTNLKIDQLIIAQFSKLEDNYHLFTLQDLQSKIKSLLD